jgi:hypothetical protein
MAFIWLKLSPYQFNSTLLQHPTSIFAALWHKFTKLTKYIFYNKLSHDKKIKYHTSSYKWLTIYKLFQMNCWVLFRWPHQFDQIGLFVRWPNLLKPWGGGHWNIFSCLMIKKTWINEEQMKACRPDNYLRWLYYVN